MLQRGVSASGGGSIDYKHIFMASSTVNTWTLHTDNATADIEGSYAYMLIENGAITEQRNNYPSLFSMSYNTTTQILTVQTKRGGDTLIIGYNDLG